MDIDFQKGYNRICICRVLLTSNSSKVGSGACWGNTTGSRCTKAGKCCVSSIVATSRSKEFRRPSCRRLSCARCCCCWAGFCWLSRTSGGGKRSWAIAAGPGGFANSTGSSACRECSGEDSRYSAGASRRGIFLLGHFLQSFAPWPAVF